MAEPEDTVPPEPIEEEVVPRARGRSWGRYIATRGLAVLLGLIALLVLGVILLDSGPGRRFVADQIQGLEFENGMKLSVGRIEGSIYGEMTLHDLSVKDPKGEFLFSPEVHVDWRPFALLDNHVDIRSATAERMILRRPPAFREVPVTDEPLLPDMDIDIGRLRVERFISEPAVTGERRIAAMSGKVHIADGRAQVRFDGRTLAGATAGGDRLSLVLDAVPEANRLDFRMGLDAPRDGVIAALAGLDQPLAVRITGKGDWQRWNGRIDANLAGTELARLTLTARDGTFAVRGPTRFARLVSGPTASLLGPVLSLDLAAALNERRADVSGAVSSDAFRLGVDGLVDLSDSSFEDLQLAFVLTRPSALAKNLGGSGIRARLTLNGEFATPRVDYALSADRLVANDMGLEGFTASGAARVDADHILIPVNARAARITGLDLAAGGTLTNVRLAGDLAIDGTRILSDNMRITSDRIDAKAILLADMAKGFYSGALDGRIGNYRIESVGIFDIQTNARLEQAREGFTLAGTVRARSTRILNDTLRSVLGGNAVAAADVRYGSDGVIRFAGLRVQAPAFRMAGGSGSYAPDGRIAFAGDATSDRYGKIGLRVAGTIADPNARITAERPDLGIGLANLEAEVEGVRNGYRLDLTGDTDYGPLRADVTLGVQGPMTLEINSADLSGVAFTGSLAQTRAGPFAGELRASGNGLDGIARLDAAGQYQQLLVNLRARDAVFDGPARLSIGSAIVDARVVLYDQPLVVADVQVSRTRLGDMGVNAARVVVNYRDGRGSARAMVEGTRGMPFRVAANADLQPELWRVAMRGKVRGIDVATASPARIVPGGEGYELMPTTIRVGEGTVRLAGTYGEGVRIQSRLEDMDLALASAFYPGLRLDGEASGSLDFVQAGASDFPRADARLSIKGLTYTTAATVSNPVDVNFAGKLLPDGGEAHAVFRLRGSVIGRLAATLRPLGPAAGSWTERLMAAPLGGGIRYNGPAGTLFSFAGQTGQQLTGPIALAADFSCRVSDPCLNGIVRAKGLTYENEVYGTRLTNLDLAGRFTGSRLEVERLTATAGEGTLDAQGYVSLSAEAGYPMNLSLALDNARLARSEAMAARATGQLRLTKVAGEMPLLSGTVRLPEARYKIVREGAAQVPALTGVRFRPGAGREPITGDEEAEPITSLFGKVRLDLTLVAPERLYVSGMGLDSEWSANLKVTGTSAQPRVSGDVSLVRGNLGFAGRSFALSQGRVIFNGGSTIDPAVNIVASDDIDDLTVNVNVSGRSSNPQIAFSSVPGLPQDEILSRVLFGNSIANISTIQAVQLAASLNSLRGGSGGLNPLGKLRSAVGIDRLRILGPDDETGRGNAIAAGQYITNDIYVELITDARGFTAAQLEVSLTPWLSVLSQAGGSGANSASVRIKKDY